MAAENMPAAEVDIDRSLVWGLLTDQHPDLVDGRTPDDLEEIAFGWDNVIYRLRRAPDDDLSIRLPRRELARALVEHELRWLPDIATRLPLPIPAPLRAGAPGRGFPWTWTVCRWFPGETAAHRMPDDLEEAATSLGGFVAALHQPAPGDAPKNPFRGVPLVEREPAFLSRIDRLGASLDNGDDLKQLWFELAGARPWGGPAIWLHGDLHPANLVVHRGRVSAVLDFGDLTGGDPATDLALAWTMFTNETRPTFRAAFERDAAFGLDDDTWRRAEAWALSHAIACLASSADNPLIAAVGQRTLDAVLADLPD